MINTMQYQIFNQDSLAFMKTLESNCVDLIIADPPYFRIKGDFDFVWKDEQEYLNNTRGIGSNKNYMSAREDFLFLTKSQNYTFNVPYSNEKSTRKDLGANGKPRKNTHKRISNVWYDITEASQSSVERCEHPTIKAQKLCDRIIQTHSNENDLIFVTFVGSGSEIISAINNNRKVFGCEIDKKYYVLAENRIKKLTKFNNQKGN